jgi:hypothetical protein
MNRIRLISVQSEESGGKSSSWRRPVGSGCTSTLAARNDSIAKNPVASRLLISIAWCAAITDICLRV